MRIDSPLVHLYVTRIAMLIVSFLYCKGTKKAAKNGQKGAKTAQIPYLWYANNTAWVLWEPKNRRIFAPSERHKRHKR
jgi:hypothetical protein